VIYRLCGIEQYILATQERPEFAEAVLKVITDLEMFCLELQLETGVCDAMSRGGWGDSTSFWSPAIYRNLLYDNVRRQVHLTHQAGLPFVYHIHSGVMPMIPLLLDLDIDVLGGVDPVQGNADMKRLKRECGHRFGFIGGLNSYITIGRGSADEIRAAVQEGIRTLGPSGLILFPMDAIDETVPWTNLGIMLDAWREAVAAGA